MPHTPTHQDALHRLIAAHQVYASADHAEGYVTVHTLTQRSLFYAENLEAVMTGKEEPAALESNVSIFERYLASLTDQARDVAESKRALVVGREVHHRHHGGAESATPRDPWHTLFLVPGAGPHPGLPGNYLFGRLDAPAIDQPGEPWTIQLHDRDDGLARQQVASREAAWSVMEDTLASAPFLLSELVDLGFELN